MMRRRVALSVPRVMVRGPNNDQELFYACLGTAFVQPQGPDTAERDQIMSLIQCSLVVAADGVDDSIAFACASLFWVGGCAATPHFTAEDVASHRSQTTYAWFDNGASSNSNPSNHPTR